MESSWLEVYERDDVPGCCKISCMLLAALVLFNSRLTRTLDWKLRGSFWAQTDSRDVLESLLVLYGA